MGFIDIHAHLDMLEEGPEGALKKAKDNGVDRIITIGTETADLPLVMDIAKRLYPEVYCTIGVHPHHGGAWDQMTADFLLKHAAAREVVAIGEIGLDYHYTQSPIEDQKKAFRNQLAIAEETGLCVEIHTRDAEQDTADILKEYSGRVRGIIHCFTSSMWLAKQCLDLGYNISFSGIVTFKNADDLREVCKYVPLDRMHVETDAPFLTPVHLRGKKNTPAYVIHTAQFVANLKGVAVEELQAQTNENARQLFPKIIW